MHTETDRDLLKNYFPSTTCDVLLNTLLQYSSWLVPGIEAVAAASTTINYAFTSDPKLLTNVVICASYLHRCTEWSAIEVVAVVIAVGLVVAVVNAVVAVGLNAVVVAVIVAEDTVVALVAVVVVVNAEVAVVKKYEHLLIRFCELCPPQKWSVLNWITCRLRFLYPQFESANFSSSQSVTHCLLELCYKIH